MKVAVTWEMCGFVDIDRPTMEEAIREIAENGDHYKLPENAEYVDGSFAPSTYDVEEQMAMTGETETGERVWEVSDIEWDTDDDDPRGLNPPDSATLEDTLTLDDIADELSDRYGFCVKGFAAQSVSKGGAR